MKRILGLDLGTNSIGWALIEILENGTKRIIKLGSRIVLMDGAEMSDFKKGLPQTKNTARRLKKGARVGNKRYKQRRNKLIYVLQKLDLLPYQIKTDKPFYNPTEIQKVNVLPIAKDTKQLTGKQFLELRVKAIHQPVSHQEFGKILYHFNQLRGYAGGNEQDDEAETANILGIETTIKNFPSQENIVDTFQILGYSPTEEKKKKKTVHKLRVKDKASKIWEGETLVENMTIGESLELKQLIRRNSKTSEITSIEFSIPKKTGWRKQMENLEDALNEHTNQCGRKTYMSEYLLDELKKNKWKKIRDNVILRARYEEEFDAIWEQQFPAHLKSVDKETIQEISTFLFPGLSESQKKYRDEVTKKCDEEGLEAGLKHIIKNQIIYFQRELKDQSHLISDCRFEPDEKAVAKSHPLFQEYKVWEQINKLSINRKIPNGFTKKGKAKFKYEERPVPATFKEYLFEQLQFKAELNFSTVFNKLKKGYDFDESVDFFNGMSSKTKLKGNTTRITLLKRLGRFWDILEMDSIENQIELWELLYNEKGNEYDLESNRNKKIAAHLKRKGIDEKEFDKIVVAISCIKFPRDYASISLKAIKKVLPLVRAGHYFNVETVPESTRERIYKVLNSNVTDDYDKSLQKYLDNNENEILEKGGFINAFALMLVYGKHTAKTISNDSVLNSFQDIKALERHSLRNPLVEQTINETLMVVKDIWKTYGKPNIIKVELARELKSSIKERSNMHERMEKNQKVNTYIKQRLREIDQELTKGNIERYKLWERQENDDPQFVAKYEATKNEIEKMKLWQEQGHIDPYTNKTIPLSALFNKGLYDIDHIIPQSRYFDDSLTNKVVCSRKVNKDKGNRTAMEYIETGSSVVPDLLSPEEFVESVGNRFYGKKRKFLLATKMPEDPIERQKKETQFIAIRVREELAKIVGSENVKTSTGGVTHYLRNHWGLTDAFKEILEPRFEQLYSIKAEKEYENLKKEAEETDKELIDFESFRKSYINEHIFKKDNNSIIKGWSKRYDHRHHAMDALTVALTDEKAVKRLNDLNKHLKDWIIIKSKEGILNIDPEADDILEQFFQEESEIRKNAMKEIERFRNISIPWKGFKKDAKKALQEIIVSHKPKDKLLLQYEKVKRNGKEINERVIKIRGPLHEETIYGLSSGLESKRMNLSSFSASTMSISATKTNIEKICNDYLRETIADHFYNTHNSNKSDAFGAEGIMGLNKRLREKTRIKNGKEEPAPHPPINSIKIYRKKAKGGGKDKISLQKIERSKSFNPNVYVVSGENYLLAVLEKDDTRIYDNISLIDAVELIKNEFNNSTQKSSFSKEKVLKEYFELKNNATFLFSLTKNDLVYVPNLYEEIPDCEENAEWKNYWKDTKARSSNIYCYIKITTHPQHWFIKHTVADIIEKKLEFTTQNAVESIEGRNIKSVCLPIKLDRLGNIIEVNNIKVK